MMKPGREISLVIGPTEVADVMTGKVVTLSPHHTFDDAANLMNDRHFRHCVVVDSYRKPWALFPIETFSGRWREIPTRGPNHWNKS